MSHTQALLNFVRSANVNNASHLENYLRTTNKRAADITTNPLDLSSSTKKTKLADVPGPKSEFKDLFGFRNTDCDNKQSSPVGDIKKSKKVDSPTSKLYTAPTVPIPPLTCMSECKDRVCESSVETIASWSVDDVCNFVGTIDLCSEYVEVSVITNAESIEN